MDEGENEEDEEEEHDDQKDNNEEEEYDDSDDDDQKIRPWDALINITTDKIQDRFNETVENKLWKKIQAQTYMKLKR